MQINLNHLIEPQVAHRSEINPASIQELADSIRAYGLLNPIQIVDIGQGNYEIIAGHRRYLAHRVLARPTIEATVIDVPHEEIDALRAIENIQRIQLSATDEAQATKNIYVTNGKDLDTTAKILGKTVGWVRTRLAVTRLPADVYHALDVGTITQGAALELAKILDADDRYMYLEWAMKSGATAAVVRLWVKDYNVAYKAGGRTEATLPGEDRPQQVPIIMRSCTTCGMGHDLTEMTPIHVCDGCMKELVGVKGGQHP